MTGAKSTVRNSSKKRRLAGVERIGDHYPVKKRIRNRNTLEPTNPTDRCTDTGSCRPSRPPETELGDVMAADAFVKFQVQENRSDAKIMADIEHTSVLEFASIDPDYLHGPPIPVERFAHELIPIPCPGDASQPNHVTGYAPPEVWRFDHLARHHEDGVLWAVPTVLGCLDLANCARWGWPWSKGVRFSQTSKRSSVDFVSPREPRLSTLT